MVAFKQISKLYNDAHLLSDNYLQLCKYLINCNSAILKKTKFITIK